MTAESTVAATIGQLRPTANLSIMDLVAEAGTDVSGWTVSADGAPVANPRSNPKYCYEWAFGGSGTPIALCVWHDSLESEREHIVFKANLRELAIKLESLTFDKREPKDIRSRAKKQASRARWFDELIQLANRDAVPLRLIIVDGDRTVERELGVDSSKVKARRLDESPWSIRNYDYDTGAFSLVRGIEPTITKTHAEVSQDHATFVDQFSIDDPLKVAVAGNAYVRSPDVRRSALQRAGGKCECCGAAGFVTGSGTVYLETHHVIPLSEGGPDHACNVVALCPNDHRRAHYGSNSLDLRDRLLDRLATLYPAQVAQLQRSRPDPIED